MNTDCDYSSAYVKLYTDSDLTGYGMTFTIGRGNDIVCRAIEELAKRLLGKDTEELFANMGKTWDYLCSDPQLRWYVSTLSRFRCSLLIMFVAGLVQRRVSSTSPWVLWIMRCGICSRGRGESPCGSLWWT